MTLRSTKMSLQALYCDQSFSYRETKNGLVLISYNEKVVTTLSGKYSIRFIAKIDPGNTQLGGYSP